MYLSTHYFVHFICFICFVLISMHMEQELFTFPEHLRVHSGVWWGSCCSISSFLCDVMWIIVWPLSFCPLCCLSFFFLYTASDYLFGIFKLFFSFFVPFKISMCYFSHCSISYNFNHWISRSRVSNVHNRISDRNVSVLVSSHDRVKTKTMKLVFVASPLSTQH